MNISPIAQVHCAVLLFGFAGLFGKLLNAAPVTIACGRTGFAWLALLLFLLLRGQSLRLAKRSDYGRMALTGLCLATHWWAFFQSIQLANVAIGLLTFASFPLFVTFLEPYFFRERLRGFDVVTAVVVTLGLVLVTPSFDLADATTRGVLWGIFSGFSFAVLALLNRGSVRYYPPVLVTCYQCGFAFWMLLPLSLTAASEPLSARDWLLLAVLGVVCTALAHGLFITGLTRIRVQLAGVIAGLEPVYGIVLALWLLGEIPAVRTLLGGVLIVGATVAAVRYRQPDVG